MLFPSKLEVLDSSKVIALSETDFTCTTFCDMIEITLLHELFHVWHDQIIGFDDHRVIKGYNRAKKSGKYASVYHLNGKKVKHYAMSNPMEYFAEMSEAYFLVNDYYPFVRVELQQSDPESYALIKSIWTEATGIAATK